VDAAPDFTRRHYRRVALVMESSRALPEMETLWRLAGRRTPLEHAEAAGATRFPDLRPRIQAIMLELILAELEQGPLVAPTLADIAVLCASQDKRVRLLGVRLLASLVK
jgi:hypothetical protein